MTVSIGLAQLNHYGQDNRHSLFERADKALYEAKQAGKNRVVYRSS